MNPLWELMCCKMAWLDEAVSLHLVVAAVVVFAACIFILALRPRVRRTNELPPSAGQTP